MKRLIILITAALAGGLCFNAQAELRCEKDWKEKIQSEKIAFLTMQMDITPQEAQTFWPVYNQIEKEKDAALLGVINTHKALAAAVQSSNTAAISKCLNEYLQAQDRFRDIESKAATQYKEVLPIEKVAKLYIAEEEFRRQHIRKLHERNKNGQGLEHQANK